MRHIGIWEENGKESVGELVIEENKIEFYNRILFENQAQIFAPKNDNKNFFVFTDGLCNRGSHCTLDHALSYYVKYVVESNSHFDIDQLNNITSVHFTFPELENWLQIATVDVCISDSNQMTASIMNLDSYIILKDKNPSVYICFTQNSSIQGFEQKTNKVSFSQFPVIAIDYGSPTNINKAFLDIRAVLQFFGLITGYVSNVNNIELFFGNSMRHRRVYFNFDFSYNMGAVYCYQQTRSTFKNMENYIMQYYENWYDFFCDERYDLIRNMYFDTNNRKSQVVQDEFVQYVRILEGYYLRCYGEEQKSQELFQQIKIVKNEIKKLIMGADGKVIFESALENALPDWNFNSKHADEIANWIATGFLNRKGLSEKLKELDLDFFNVINKNSSAIQKFGKEQEKPFNYYKAIADTRNYFSHYKETKENVMNFRQMIDTIKVLKALMTMILLSHMGMEKNVARDIIMQDRELYMRTQCLKDE